ncbi:MAG TPA: metallophosphoesterase [Stellaceae bacterium]|nr:metallophosphoesterase [Stellaceae bacterium]
MTVPSTPDRDVLVVHSSDVHVDSLAEDGVHNLRLVLDTARELAADVVILAGDTFDHNRLPLGLLGEAGRLLGAAGRPVVILPGNHDPVIPESAFHRGALGDIPNVAVIGITHDEAVDFPEFDLEIWGRAHRDYGNMGPLEFPRARRTRWQIAMAHGHYEPAPDPAQKLCPSWLISDAEIAATGADYVALGHWNRAIRVGPAAIEAYYSGSPDLAATVNLVRLARDGTVRVSREKLIARAEPA